MRPRSRVAVSVFVDQIGSRIWSRCCVAICATFNGPMTGKAYRSSVASHCLACFFDFQPGACAAT
jgi:hypothetical protein